MNIFPIFPCESRQWAEHSPSKIEWVDADTARVTYEDGHIQLVGTTDISLLNDLVSASSIRLETGNSNSSSAMSQSNDMSSSSLSSSISSSASSKNSSSSLKSSASAMSQSSMSARARAGIGEFCGGIAGIMCQDDLTCDYDGSYPDAGGTCIR